MSDHEDTSDDWDQRESEQCATLSPKEVLWSGKQPFLANRGYMLRPRYRPGWIPSWYPGLLPYDTAPEDAVGSRFLDHQMAATRVSDGKMVFIERVDPTDEDIQILLYFSTGERKNNSRNHVIPVLDIFADDEEPTLAFIVFPYLRHAYSPQFRYMRDIADFIDQTLEGLAYMHEHNVVHRDCTRHSIFVDATYLFPDGFNPDEPNWSPDLSSFARPVSRYRAAGPVKYYFRDFRTAVRMPPDSPKRVVGTGWCATHCPEWSDYQPYDPFKLDIYILGAMYRNFLRKNFKNLTFLRQVYEPMVRWNPYHRCDAAMALKNWRRIRENLSLGYRGARLVPVSENCWQTAFRNTRAFCLTSFVLSNRVLARMAHFVRVFDPVL